MKKIIVSFLIIGMLLGSSCITTRTTTPAGDETTQTTIASKRSKLA